jgi:hypothetical protein
VPRPAASHPDLETGSEWRTAALSPRDHVRVLTMVGKFPPLKPGSLLAPHASAH